MTPIAKFVRSDGTEFEAHEGSESFNLMMKDGQFERVDKPKSNEAESADNDQGQGDEGQQALATKPLSKMKKAELVAIVEELGLEVVPDAMTNKQIIDLIEKHNAKPAETKDKDQSENSDTEAK